MPTSAPTLWSNLSHHVRYVRKKKRVCIKGKRLISLICSPCHAMEQLQMDNGIIIYLGHLTKFCVLWPIKSKYSTEVAAQLMDIFPLFGAPSILHNDNGTEFTAQTISDIKDFWPALVMVLGKPRHPQIHGCVEGRNGDIKDVFVARLADNDTHDWVTGVMFVRFQRNYASHWGIKRSPYPALFGDEVRVGLTSSMPQKVLSKLDSEEDLLAVVMDQLSTSTSITSSTLRFRCTRALCFQCSGALCFQCSGSLRFQCSCALCFHCPGALCFQCVSSVPAPSVSSVPAPSVSSVPAPSVSIVPAPSVSSVPALSVSSVPTPSVSSVPAPSVSSFLAPSVSSVPAPSVSSVPAPSVSMGAYAVNFAIPEGTDTETVRDISVTVISEETVNVHSAQRKRCRYLCKSGVSGPAYGEKKSGGL